MPSDSSRGVPRFAQGLLVLLVIAVVAAAFGACGGGGSETSTANGAANGGDITQVASRLQAAGYVVSEDSPIAHQVTDDTGEHYRPEAGFTIFQPDTGVYVLLSVSSDPDFIRAFKSELEAYSSHHPVIVRGDRAYALSPSGEGTDADLEKAVKVAEGE